MDALSTFLDEMKKSGKTQGSFLGLLNVLIGRRVERNGAVIARGLTWRELAGYLKKHRWDPAAVRELGLDPDELPPRDRQRYWYTAIAQAQVDGAKAQKAGDRFAETLRGLGYEIGSGPKQAE
jgi:hypothetical protein